MAPMHGYFGPSRQWVVSVDSMRHCTGKLYFIPPFSYSWLTFDCDSDGHAHELIAKHVVLPSADARPAHDILFD